MNTISSTSGDGHAGADVIREQRRQQLREAVDEVVGVTFFGQMLKIARNSVIKGEYGHGGRGEDMFGPQLDMELARMAGRGVQTSLGDSLYRRFEKGV